MCIWMLIRIVIDQRYFVKVPRGSVSMLPSQRRCTQYFFEKKKTVKLLIKDEDFEPFEREQWCLRIKKNSNINRKSSQVKSPLFI